MIFTLSIPSDCFLIDVNNGSKISRIEDTLHQFGRLVLSCQESFSLKLHISFCCAARSQQQHNLNLKHTRCAKCRCFRFFAECIALSIRIHRPATRMQCSTEEPCFEQGWRDSFRSWISWSLRPFLRLRLCFSWDPSLAHSTYPNVNKCFDWSQNYVVVWSSGNSYAGFLKTNNCGHAVTVINITVKTCIWRKFQTIILSKMTSFKAFIYLTYWTSFYEWPIPNAFE